MMSLQIHNKKTSSESDTTSGYFGKITIFSFKTRKKI